MVRSFGLSTDGRWKESADLTEPTPGRDRVGVHPVLGLNLQSLLAVLVVVVNGWDFNCRRVVVERQFGSSLVARIRASFRRIRPQRPIRSAGRGPVTERPRSFTPRKDIASKLISLERRCAGRWFASAVSRRFARGCRW